MPHATPSPTIKSNTPNKKQNLASKNTELLLESARTKTLRALVKAEIFLDRELPLPKIDFNLRGKTAGIFQYRTIRSLRGHVLDPNSLIVRLNHALLETHTDQFIREVIPHEISHLAVYCHYGTRPRPHGKEWQNLMENCYGLPANVYHNFPVARARKHARPYAYQCDCDLHYFTARRHNNRLRGNQYVCQKCRGLLEYVGKLTAAP